MPENKNPETSDFSIKLPEALMPVDAAAALEMLKLIPEIQQKIDAQLKAFIDGLLGDALDSKEFRSKLDSAFRLGKEELSNAASLMTGRYMDRNLVGVKGSVFMKSLESMRALLDQFDPTKYGDLAHNSKFLGLIPMGNKLKDYFCVYQSAMEQTQKNMTDLFTARDEMKKDAEQIEVLKNKLWNAMHRLKGAIYFGENLQKQIAAQLEAIKKTDPQRAERLVQDVLNNVHQNIEDMTMQMSVNMNGYRAMETLQKIASEMVTGCERIASSSLLALGTSQQVALSTGNPIQVMETLAGLNETIAKQVAETSQKLAESFGRTDGAASSQPEVGVKKMQEMFGASLKAMTDFENIRNQATNIISQNQQMIRELMSSSLPYLERSRTLTVNNTPLSADDPDHPVRL